MSLRNKLQKAWENRAAIAEGFYNEYISSDKEIKEEAERRREICKGCEYYDPTGTKEIIVVKGEPGCLLCGCNTKLMTASMQYSCSAGKIGLKPRWDAVLSQEQQNTLAEIQYKKQFEKPNQ